MSVNTDSQKIEELLSRGVENIFPNKEFLEKELKSGRQLTLYSGYDPTAPTLHIGHGITMLKLRQFQDLGHKVIMLIGDFTGMIGDPTDKTSARQKLTHEQVLENCKLYQKQAEAILNFKGDNAVEVKYNSEWLGKMNLGDVLELTSHFTVQQMLERDMFEKRMAFTYICPNCNSEQIFSYAHLSGKDFISDDRGLALTRDRVCTNCEVTHLFENFTVGENFIKISTPKEVEKKVKVEMATKPIYIHEFLYPLMQGYDSVAMNVDGEVGGNDQTFNMLVGRDLIRELKHKEKFVVATKLLTDDKGKKMGKSEGNMVALCDAPENMFGKVMSWTDGMISNGFELCTRLSLEEIKKLQQELKNPRDLKVRLAFEITKLFLGEPAAEQAQNYFISTFSKKEIPDEIPELKPSAYDIITVLVEAKFVKSKSEAREVIKQKGVKVNEEKVEDIAFEVKKGDVVQKGSRFFVKIV